MSPARFTEDEWAAIDALDPSDFGLPSRVRDSALVGTFNALKLSGAEDEDKHWDYLRDVCRRFDLLAVQEVLDDLSGLERLVGALPDHEVIVSDTTGKFPGAQRGLTERLAFIYRPARVQLDGLASDITYDRSWVLETLERDRAEWNGFFDDLAARRTAWEQIRRGSRPSISNSTTPAFLTFIRQPHCVAFTLRNTAGGTDVSFLAINAHLLYGNHGSERKREFEALLDWLIYRAQDAERMYHTNITLFGDLNLEFRDAGVKRSEIDDRLRALNQAALGSNDAALVNFPLLSVHPERAGLPAREQLFRTNARSSQTYDQIAFFIHPQEFGLPLPSDNDNAGAHGASGYDYGVFRFTDLAASALHRGSSFRALPRSARDRLIRRVNSGFSDHLPAWVRIPLRQ
jgi:hypothetical protein